MRGISPQLRAPTVMMILCAGVTAYAFAAGGWKQALGLAAIAVVAPVAYYLLGRADSDLGAMAGHRPDERQRLLRLQARAFAAQAMVTAAAIGAVITIFLRHPAWPFYLVVGVGTLAFFARLAYGTREAGLPDAGIRHLSMDVTTRPRAVRGGRTGGRGWPPARRGPGRRLRARPASRRERRPAAWREWRRRPCW